MPELLLNAGLAEPIEGSVRLSDGRQLGYAEYGDHSGAPLFHFHGHPGSRLEAAILHEAAAEAGIRLIGVDRPGMGFSDFKPGHRLLDWSADVGELADSLDLDRFSVQGISGGGPYALATAFSIPERLNMVTVISGASPGGLGSNDQELPINRLQRRMVKYAPFLVDVAFRSMAKSTRQRMEAHGPVTLGRAALAGLPVVDQRALAEPDLAGRYGTALHEAFRQGGSGAAHDAKLLSRPWGFDVGKITHPNLHVWHGALDRNVSISSGRELVQVIPGARGHFYDDEGHISVAISHGLEILTTARIGR